MKRNSFFFKLKKLFTIPLTLLLISTYNLPLLASLTKNDEEINNIQNNIYLIGPGDAIRLDVIDVPELSTNLEVLPDGTIFVPLVGSIMVNNLTIDKAKILIQKRLEEHLLVPEIQLSLLSLKPIRVTLIGELQKPGIYLFENQGIDNKKVTTLVDAIREAGGLTGQSYIEEIKVVRKYPVEDKLDRKVAYFNLWELINKGDQDNNPVLFDGDSIFISKAKETSEESSEFAFANLTPDTINVKIIGSVVFPGEIELPINTPLSQAIYSAGGPVELIAKKNAQLIRLNRNGTVTNTKYKISKNLSTSDQFNPPLRDNDIVLVPSNNFNKVTGAINTVASPFTGVITILGFLKLLDEVN